MGEYRTLIHTFEPVFDSRSRVLILGTFPSVKSREGSFYYHHPQNRFWKVIAQLTKAPVPVTVEEKKELLLKSRIAIWDVVQQCDIIGSSDSSIKNVIPADLSRILSQCPIQSIFANGEKAASLYRRHLYPVVQKEIIVLPSTSPANAAYSLERLVEAWSLVKQDLECEK